MPRILATLLVLAGCGPQEHSLFVDVRSDLLPVQEVEAVRVTLASAGETAEASTVPLEAGADLLGGVRVAEREALPAGVYDLRVALLDADGVEVVARDARVQLSTPLAVTVVLTSDCRGVECSAGQTCAAGACVDASCTDEAGRPCDPAECASDGDCGTELACGLATCVGGACLEVPDASRCAGVATCDRELGCRRIPWGPAEPVVELDDPARIEDDPTLRLDRLEILFTVRDDRFAPGDLVTARRASADAPWGPPTLVAELNGPGNDVNPMLSRDGLTLYFVQDGRIVAATRPDLDAPWEDIVPAESFTGFGNVGCPAPSDHELTLLFCAGTMPSRDVYRAERASRAEPFGPPSRVVELDSDADDLNGYFGLPGRLAFYFTSTRAGGERDLYVTRRAEPDAPFGPPERLDELAADGDDENPWVTDDERVLYFASDRGGSLSLWRATR